VTSAELLTAFDRDPRAAYWSQSWQKQKMLPNEVLRQAVATGLLSTDDDPGQAAGDEVMTLAAERGLDTKQFEVYGQALHLASLADIVTTVVRGAEPPWARPADQMVNGLPWASNAFLEPSGVRLRRVVIVDRWDDNRRQAESHSYFSLGEIAAYQMPMSMTVIVTGQSRDGRHHGPWSKGYFHPRFKLRIRKRSGEGFDGNWVQIWREEHDELSRDKWIETMQSDGVFDDLKFDIEVPVPCEQIVSKIRKLIEKRLTVLSKMKETPLPSISQCDWPVPCMFRDVCWSFSEPSEKNGFTKIPLPA
jgi:hypothetical protein